MEGLVDLAAIDAFLAFHHGKESPVVAILAMYDTFDRGCEKSGEGCPMRGVPSDESITPFIARGFSDHNARVLQGVRKAWDAA